MSKTRSNYDGKQGLEVLLAQAETIHIALSGAAAALVRDALDSGKYESAAEVVSDALRDWHRERDAWDVPRLQALWDEAQRDERPGLDPEPINARLRQKFSSSSRGSSRL